MRTLSTFVVATVLGLVTSSCGKTDVEQVEILRPVRFLTVTDNDLGRSRTFSGTSRSTQVSRLSFKVSGTIVQLPIEVGDRLDAGGLLARLDTSSFDLEVQQAQAGLVQAQANQRNAESNYDRIKGLYENTNASRNDLDSARANAESARAQTRSAQKSLELARLNLSYTRLTADRRCLVASVGVDLNENVVSGAEVARVNCGEGLEIELAMPDSLIAEIREDANVIIRFDAIPKLTFAGTVTEIGVAASSGTPTFPVTVSIDGSERRLRSGLAADVTFEFASTRSGDAHLIPLAAVANRGAEPFVYIATPDGSDNEAVVEKRTVEIGELTENGIEVLAGLNHGDRVVTAGVSIISAGQRVLLD